MDRRHPAILQLVSLTILSLWGRSADGVAVLELKMDVYNNAAGEIANGGTCHLFGLLKCSHYFTFSLDIVGGSSSAQNGFYSSQLTGVFEHENIDYFGVDMDGVSNPIVQQFSTWPGSVVFKVYVQNQNAWPVSPDYVDSIIYTFTLTPQGTQATSTWTDIVLNGVRTKNPTTLQLDYRLYCSDNHYGPTCAVLCIAADDSVSGHYTCHPNTGLPVCLPGWQQDPTNLCLTEDNPCTSNLCQNGATCISGMGAYTCSCPAGFAGSFCEVSVEVSCPAGFAGRSCDVKICDFLPCLNGGTCMNGACQCPIGFAGANCQENNMCFTRPCMNAGTCAIPQQLFICSCLTGYQGGNCSDTVPTVANISYAQSDAQLSGSTSSSSCYQIAQALIALIVLCCVLAIVLIILVIFILVWRRRVRKAELKYTIVHKGVSSSSSIGTEASTIGESSFESRRFRSISSVSSCGDGDEAAAAAQVAARRRTTFSSAQGSFPSAQASGGGDGSESPRPANPPGYDELSAAEYVMSSLSKAEEAEYASVPDLKM